MSKTRNEDNVIHESHLKVIRAMREEKVRELFTERTYNHAEAFCLMPYMCSVPDCSHSEVIWNSRDGVTPFILNCPSCGEPSLIHVFRDIRCIDHKLHMHQRFFRDGTREEAEKFLRKRFKRMSEDGIKLPRNALTIALESIDSNEGEFQKGWPMIDVYQG